MCVHIGVCHVADTPCISCSCHWQFLKYPVCTFHTIFHWHIYPEWISYTCQLKYFLCAFQCCHWNVFLFHCMSSNGWFNKNDIHTNHPPPPHQPTKTWPIENYEKRRKKQLSSRTNAEMYTSKISERGLTQTLYTYICMYS